MIFTFMLSAVIIAMSLGVSVAILYWRSTINNSSNNNFESLNYLPIIINSIQIIVFNLIY